MGFFTKAVAVLARGLGLTDPRLAEFFGGGETDSGERVSVDGSLQLGAVWACVNLIASTVATLPLNVYRNDKQGFRVLDPDHPLTNVLGLRPNFDMTAVGFLETSVAQLLLWGNWYWAIGRNRFGVNSLYPMRPDCVMIRVGPDGTRTYTYSWQGKTETFAESDVLHLKGFSLDGLLGLSVISAARNNLGAARAAERASASIFRNGMRPSGILTAPNYLTDPQRQTAKTILANFKGAGATGSTPLLEGGWTWQSLTIPPEDAQMLATMSFNIELICQWFGVPPVMIGHMDKQSSWGTGVEQVMLHFYQTSLRTLLERIEAAINVGLLTPEDQAAGVRVRFTVEGLLRADSAGRASYYSTMVQNGIYTRNYVRGLEGLPPLPNGDDLTVQANLLPIGDLGKVAKLPADKEVIPGASISASSPQNGSSTPIPEIRQ